MIILSEVVIPAEIAIVALTAMTGVFGWVLTLVIKLTVEVSKLTAHHEDFDKRLTRLEGS